MTGAKSQTGELDAHRIDELREAIHDAIAAIAGNRLQALEESLWRQEVLCTGLKHLVQTVQSASVDTTLDTRLQRSITALHHLNQSYAELLRQAQASNHLLYTAGAGHGLDSCERTGSAVQRCSLEA
jgi:hypothetical protein